MKSLLVIPARYSSSRFPGKPLASIAGKPMIQRVYEQSKKSKASRVIVATEDLRIYDAVLEFGGEAMMTSKKHKTGTERCAEVLEQLENDGHFFDIMINAQGDEPLIQPDELDRMIDFFNQNNTTEILTLVKKITNIEELYSSNVVKVVGTIFHENNADALYFSRQAIPSIRDLNKEEWLEKHTYYKHIGIYAFQASIVPELIEIPSSPLENAENLEQLRWIQDHFVISLLQTDYESQGVDTPDDVLKVEQLLANHPHR